MKGRLWIAAAVTVCMAAGPISVANARPAHRSERMLQIQAAGPEAHTAGLAGRVSPASQRHASAVLAAAPMTFPIMPTWFKDSTVYEVNVRQYTPEGTFNAFAKHLPRLKQLGVKVLWLMPIHPIGQEARLGSLGSYYSVRDYTKVNSEFGTAADFKALVKTAHSMGFKVILDWVANHTAWDNPWVTQHPSWYTQDSRGNIISPAGTGWSDVADLNYASSALRVAMIAAMRGWVKDYGVDGFRCDVAGMVPTDFWEKAVTELAKVKPVLMLAENQSNADLLSKAFLINYNWSLLSELRNIGVGWVDNTRIRDLIGGQRGQYPNGSMPMNFITNHDENSWNGTEYEKLGDTVADATVAYFTLPGVPLVYSGQEVGLRSRLKFFDKDEIDWTPTSGIGGLVTKLTALKKRNSALWNGSAGGSTAWLRSDSTEVFSYARQLNRDRVVVVVNPTDHANKVTVTLGGFAGKYMKLTDGKSVTLPATYVATLKPYAYEVFSSK